MAEPVKETVAIRAPDGTVGHVAAADAAQAIDAGSELVTPEEVHAATIQAEYGGAGGQAKAALAGAGRGLTFGLSDHAIAGIGGEGARQELADLKEANPYASLGGEFAGALAPTLFSGGAAGVAEAGNLARGVRAIGILPRGAAALGEGAAAFGRGIVGEGATSLGGRALQRAIPMALQGASEGALYGAGGAVSEAALGPDHDLTAEKILAGAAKGAVFGGGVGGALGLAGGALSHIRAPATADALESVAARHIGEDAAPGLGAALKAESKASGAADFAAERIASAAKDPQEAALLREHWARRETSLFDAKEQLTADVRDFAKHLDSVVEAEERVNAVAYGESKAKEMAQLVDGQNWRAARESALEVWQKGKDRLALLEADPTRGGSGPAVSRIGKLWEKFEGQIQTTAVKATKDKPAWAREVFVDLDNLKRAVGKQAGMGMHPNMRTPAQREFFDLYHEIQPVLENEGIWGKAATAQKEINEAATKLYSTRSEFAGKFLRQGFESKGGNAIDRANPDGIQSHLRSLGVDPAGDLNQEALTRYMRDVEGFASNVEKHYAGGKAEGKAIADMKASLGTMRGTLDRTAKAAKLTNQLQAARAEEMASGIGGAIGLITDAASRKFTTLDRLASIERGVKRIDEGIRGGVKAFLAPNGGGVTNADLARGMKLPPKAKNPAPALMDGPKSKYTSRAAAISAMASNPDAQASHMARVTDNMSDHAPNTAAALSMVSARGTAYLASQLPGGHIDPRSLTPHLEKRRVSDIEADQWLRRYEAVENPLGVIDDMRKGKLSREAVEAMKVVYPKIYQQMQGEVMTQLVERTTPLAYAQKLQLGLLLDIPTDATLAPDFISAIQATYGPGGGPENDNGGGGEGSAPASTMKPVNISRLYGGALDSIEDQRRE